ncbi:MAG: STAS domain-containing protein [Chthoniobacterales bacterium]
MELLVVESSDTFIQLALAGSLNIGGVEAVELKFLAYTTNSSKPVIVDISGVDFVSSLGLRMFLEGARGLRRTGKTLVLLHPTPEVEKVLEITAISMVAVVSHSEDDALVKAGVA